ncbi:MAG TPA: ATP-dependent DNA helicase RecG [Phycisphaerae bacterium]|nr:ATP-dependent DNA helicase RecG [Phycisphaerae bacterium]
MNPAPRGPAVIPRVPMPMVRPSHPATAPPPSLNDPVQFLPGVGPRRAEALAKVGVRTVGDLLEYFPARHERQEFRTIEHLEEGMTATIVGRIGAVAQKYSRRGPTVRATLIDNTGRCSLSWFNAPWIADRIERGSIVEVTGRVGVYGPLAEFTNPKIAVLDKNAPPVDESRPARLEPVYPATADLPVRAIRKLILDNLDRLLPLVQEPFTESYRRERDLPARSWSIAAMHRPTNEVDVTKARRRLAYEELLLMQLAVTLARHQRRSGPAAPVLKSSPQIDERIRRRFPFRLTKGQERAISEIVRDLAADRPMLRLVQGDVGCGKTVVALYAGLVSVANKHQFAIMAPTELLAQQHYRSICRYLEGSRVRHSLLIGGLPAARRRQMLKEIEHGEMDLVVGTHALIQEDVRFAKLGLVVVDEQHRFGVRQRATIKSKGPAPHYLVMTATPIPRTLAMTVFGDLDVTTIEDLPPGRSPITTRVATPLEQSKAWDFVRTRLGAGEQAYVVYPLIDESDKVEARAATTEYKRLSQQVFAGHRVGLLHGRLPQEVREAVMADFIAGRIAVLVATTVVEVGVDVANATCMVIEHAERYGLSQLHQLRGRVGRGAARGYCLLMTGSVGGAEGERLGVLARTTDGFKIAEEDLRLRGPGEMLGTRQHGLPELRVADLIRDGELLRMAQRDAGRIIADDPSLTQARYANLRHWMESKYRDALTLAGAG